MKQINPKIDFPTEIVQEGIVRVRVPKLSAFVESASEYAPSKAPVFYNPIMEFNRDIAVLALQAYQEMLNRPLSVCEPLAGCGVRGVRFAKEVGDVKKVVINDLNYKAFQLSHYNVRFNKLTEKIDVRNEDANLVLAIHGAPQKRFDAIDIDPFGPPSPFLDSAIRALHSGGFLMLTATDMAPLCGIHPIACVRKYGGRPLHTEYCPELAVRLLAGSLVKASARYEMATRIVLSHSTNHYIRIYAILEHGAREANESIKKIGYILHCFQCFHRETIEEKLLPYTGGECNECGSRMNIAGPLWLGRIASKEFCKSVQEKAKQRPFKLGKKIRRVLGLIEIETEAPITYYVLDRICSDLSLPVPSVRRVVKTLREDGFQACQTHFDPRGIKSDVSADHIKEVLKEIVCG